MRILRGDCLVVMKEIESSSIDAVVTDPPYGLEFMGKDWDGADGFRRSLNAADAERDSVFGRMSRRGPEYRAGSLYQEWCEAWASECLRVLKPGAHLLAFGGSRTYHRLACAIEDAGFEIRDQVQWIYGQGMPKHKSVLKPAHEPIVLARKPLDGTIMSNVLKWGTGALNINATRIGTSGAPAGADAGPSKGIFGDGLNGSFGKPVPGLGRWPANIVHDGSDEVLDLFPNSAGQLADARTDGSPKTNNVFGRMRHYREPSHDRTYEDHGGTNFAMKPGARRADTGSAARFFYCAKASKAEREGSKHPTVKPLALMRWLTRLVTPVNGIILDPFAGTGTTGEAAKIEGFRCVMIEQDPDYTAHAMRRVTEERDWP